MPHVCSFRGRQNLFYFEALENSADDEEGPMPSTG